MRLFRGKSPVCKLVTSTPSAGVTVILPVTAPTSKRKSTVSKRPNCKLMPACFTWRTPLAVTVSVYSPGGKAGNKCVPVVSVVAPSGLNGYLIGSNTSVREIQTNKLESLPFLKEWTQSRAD